MRIERAFYINGMPADVRDAHHITCVETCYCEDPKCERTHEDTEILWDSRCTFEICVAHGRDAADLIIGALRLAAALERAS